MSVAQLVGTAGDGSQGTGAGGWVWVGGVGVVVGGGSVRMGVDGGVWVWVCEGMCKWKCYEF